MSMVDPPVESKLLYRRRRRLPSLLHLARLLLEFALLDLLDEEAEDDGDGDATEERGEE